jgi:hypothetical protein
MRVAPGAIISLRSERKFHIQPLWGWGRWLGLPQVAPGAIISLRSERKFHIQPLRGWSPH